MPEPTSIADLPWWELFHDDVLQFLIAESLKNNYDLQTAIARVESARGVLISTRSQMFPQAEYQGGALRGRQFQGPSVTVPLPSGGRATFGGNPALNPFLPHHQPGRGVDLWGPMRQPPQLAQADRRGPH